MKPPTVPDTVDVLLTPAETAAWLKIKPRQLERFGVPAVRLGHKTIRYLRADVLAWLQTQRAPVQRRSGHD
jgi:hypothetical protein